MSTKSIITNKECYGCFACATICPTNSIQMAPNEEGFLYPRINEKSCVKCKKCEAVCPGLSVRENISSKKAFMMMNENVEERIHSASGGVFYLLAKKWLSSGGIVFGAAYSNDYRRVQHVSIDRDEDLFKLQTSKYVQSEIGQSFSEVKNILNLGKKVLYSGTPCQIAGLKNFLGQEEYDGLLCLELVCHGVPSADMWNAYLDHQERKNGKVTYVNMRCKVNGWRKHYKCEIKDGRGHFFSRSEDRFLRLFNSDAGLRESCYQCKYKEGTSGADITIGDFWGSKALGLDNDGNGVSLTIINTPKGYSAIKMLGKNVKCTEVEISRAISGNPSYFKAARRPDSRESFYTDLHKMPFEKVYKKYCGRPPLQSMKVKIKNSCLYRCIFKTKVEGLYGMLIVCEKEK